MLLKYVRIKLKHQTGNPDHDLHQERHGRRGKRSKPTTPQEIREAILKVTTHIGKVSLEDKISEYTTKVAYSQGALINDLLDIQELESKGSKVPEYLLVDRELNEKAYYTSLRKLEHYQKIKAESDAKIKELLTVENPTRLTVYRLSGEGYVGDKIEQYFQDLTPYISDGLIVQHEVVFQVNPLVGRSRYNYTDIEFTHAKLGIVAHEFGHQIEHDNPGILKEFVKLYERRTAGQTPEPLSNYGTGFDASEFTIKDNFIDPYMGKSVYVKRYKTDTSDISIPVNTELFSMGFELLMTDPKRLAKQDPELFDLVVAALQGKL